MEQEPGIENQKTEGAPLETRVDAALENQKNDLSWREAGHDKTTLSGLRKFLTAGMLMGVSLLAIGCKAEKPSSGFTDNQNQNVQRRLEIKRQEIKHMKEAEIFGHKQTFGDYRQQYKRLHPSPFKTKHATPKEAQQVREANGDDTKIPQNEEIKSTKTTSPEAEEFLNNN